MLFRRKWKYPSLSFAENYLGGHISVGRVTVYGANAMHWAVNIRTKRWGYICFRLPFRCYKRWWPLYCYVSEDGTPTRAHTWLWGQRKECPGWPDVNGKE